MRIGSLGEDGKNRKNFTGLWVVLFSSLAFSYIFLLPPWGSSGDPLVVGNSCNRCPLAQSRLVNLGDLQKAQKDINRKLGLPPGDRNGTEGNSASTQGSRSRRTPTSPLISWSLVAISTAGIGILFLIFRKEIKKIRQFEKNPLGILSKDREPFSFGVGKKVEALPDLVRPSPEHAIAPFPPFPESSRTLEEETTVLSGKLDQFLDGMREQTGPLKESFDISVQRFDPKLKSFFRLGQVTGKLFPSNHVLGFLNEDMASAWKGNNFTEWEKDPLPREDGTASVVFSIGVPFFDNKGQLYALTISCANRPDLPARWYDGFKEFIPDIQKILLDYPGLRYSLPTETRNTEGELDIRAVENRVFLEIQKGSRIGTVFTLLFIRLAATGKTNPLIFLAQEFFPRFKRRAEDTLRQGDSLAVLPENVILILFPETNRREAHYVLERIIERFESLSVEYKNHNIQIFSNFLEWRPGSSTSPQILLKNGLRLSIPQEKSEEEQLLEHLRKKRTSLPESDPNNF